MGISSLHRTEAEHTTIIVYLECWGFLLSFMINPNQAQVYGGLGETSYFNHTSQIQMTLFPLEQFADSPSFWGPLMLSAPARATGGECCLLAGPLCMMALPGCLPDAAKGGPLLGLLPRGGGGWCRGPSPASSPGSQGTAVCPWSVCLAFLTGRQPL